MRLGRIATLAMLAIVASVPAMAQTIVRSGEPFNPPAVSVRRYVTRMVDSLGGHKAGMRDSAVWETPARSLPVPMPMGGMYPGDTTSRIFNTDANGNLYVTDSSPFYDVLLGPTTIIGPGQAFVAGYADSNAVPLDTHRASSGTLYVKAWRQATGVGTVAHFAVEVRGHINGGQDSLTTMVLSLAPQATTFTSGTAVDTLNAGIGQSITPSATVCGSGEWPMVMNLALGSPLSGTPVPFSYPNGIAINLARLYGPDLGLHYMSIRVRQLSGPACYLTVTYEGRP